MKTILIVFIIGLFSTFSVQAQDLENKSRNEQGKFKYCAKIKDGKMVMMQDDKELTADVQLSNGGKIKTDGTVIKPDGFVIILVEGECVDDLGNIFPPKEKTNIKDIPGKK